MRIATSQRFDRPTLLMAGLNAQADKLQNQIATGKKLAAPSDDATAYSRLESLRRAASDDSAYAGNLKLAQGVLAQADTALGSVETQLQRAQELAIQASNGTISDANRAALAAEIDGILDELYALANTSDVRGQPLFGGASGDTAYAKGADGSIAYVGTGDPAPIPIGPGDAVHATVSGDRVFGTGAATPFAILSALSTALKAGGDVNDAAATALDGIQNSLDQVASTRASLGARAIRLDLAADRMTETGIARAEERSGIEEVDVTTAIAELQKTLTILQATQASFTKLSGLSLFDYLR